MFSEPAVFKSGYVIQSTTLFAHFFLLYVTFSHECKFNVAAVETYSERRIRWDSAFWRPAREALEALRSLPTKQMQLH